MSTNKKVDCFAGYQRTAEKMAAFTYAVNHLNLSQFTEEQLQALLDACNHHQAGLFRASIPRFNSSLPAQFPAMFIKIAGKCDIAFRTSNPNALSIRFSDGCMLLPAEWARFQRFAGLFVAVHAVFPPSSSTSSLSTDTLKYRATFISCLMLGP